MEVFFLLNNFPLVSHLIGGVKLALRKNMRMAALHFIADIFDSISNLVGLGPGKVLWPSPK